MNAGTLVLGGGVRLKNCRVFAASAVYSCGLAVLLLIFGARVLQNAVAEGDTRTISLHHIHTDENITITFKRDGRYDEAALEKLNWFLRDWRREAQTRMDPHLIDLIWEVQRETGSQQPIWVVCGYRSPETNAMLRRRSNGVARFSQHMLGHAMDFYIPGVALEQLRVIGLRLQRGGVGFYPTSGSPFVHLDTGGVRHWPRMTREQLVSVFPDGRTVHIPADGRPLPGYALALADLRSRGDNPSEMSIEAARNAGYVAEASIAHRIVNPFAKMLGFKQDDEDDDAGGAAPAVMASNPPAPAAEPLRTRAKAAVVAVIDRTEDKLATEKAKFVRVASRAEEKLATDKARIVAAAAKAKGAIRAEAAQLATLTPSQTILARGFWQGVPDGMSAARPAQTSANPLAALPRAPREAVASAETGTTGSLGPLAVASVDRVPSDVALAYAEQPDRETASHTVSVAAAISMATPRATVTGPVAVQAGNNEMTIAVKRIGGRPVSAILTVANKSKLTFADGADPWLRAIVMSPSVHRFLSITTLGLRDFHVLTALMAKPANSVMMTFAADPNPGLAPDHFSGSAIVFVSTVTYPMRTADLR